MGRTGWNYYFKGKKLYVLAFGGCAQFVFSVAHEGTGRLHVLHTETTTSLVHKLYQVSKADGRLSP